MTRARACEGRGECSGSSIDGDVCNTELCPGEIWLYSASLNAKPRQIRFVANLMRSEYRDDPEPVAIRVTLILSDVRFRNTLADV